MWSSQVSGSYWKEGNGNKLELPCEDRNLQMQLLASLGHPDKPHIPDPYFLTLSEEEVFFSTTLTIKSLMLW